MLTTALETLPGGRRIRVARLGAGPPLILLHGYPDNLQIWSAMAPLLARHFSVIAFDWPGMGYSDPWSGGVTPQHMAGRVLELMDIWRIDRAHLMGLDMGGQPALVFAARNSRRIGSLCAMNSLVLWDEKTSWEIAILRRFGWNRLVLRHLPRLVFGRALHTFLPVGEPIPDDLRGDLWTAFRTPEVRRFVAKMCAGYQGSLPQLPEFYSQIGCPTLLLWAERDRHFPPAHAERLHQLIRCSQCDVIPGAEHWMVWTQAAEVARRYLAWHGFTNGQP